MSIPLPPKPTKAVREAAQAKVEAKTVQSQAAVERARALRAELKQAEAEEERERQSLRAAQREVEKIDHAERLRRLPEAVRAVLERCARGEEIRFSRNGAGCVDPSPLVSRRLLRAPSGRFDFLYSWTSEGIGLIQILREALAAETQ